MNNNNNNNRFIKDVLNNQRQGNDIIRDNTQYQYKESHVSKTGRILLGAAGILGTLTFIVGTVVPSISGLKNTETNVPVEGPSARRQQSAAERIKNFSKKYKD